MGIRGGAQGRTRAVVRPVGCPPEFLEPCALFDFVLTRCSSTGPTGILLTKFHSNQIELFFSYSIITKNGFSLRRRALNDTVEKEVPLPKEVPPPPLEEFGRATI